MKLYVTPLSPYARFARIVILEKGLEDRVEVVVARTRVADSPYYRVNPSGRVPHLVLDDGTGLEESSLICAYLDHLDGAPAFELPSGDEGWEPRRLEALARSWLDGFTVWGRELRHRPEDERSPRILAHERARCERLTAVWEREIESPWMRGALNIPQITVACAMQYGEHVLGLAWTPRPRLSAWLDAIAARPSLAATAPAASLEALREDAG